MVKIPKLNSGNFNHTQNIITLRGVKNAHEKFTTGSQLGILDHRQSKFPGWWLKIPGLFEVYIFDDVKKLRSSEIPATPVWR